MKTCFAARRTLLSAAFLFLSLLIAGSSVKAQSPVDVPPAYGVAQRLQAEAVAASAAGNAQIAHNRYYQAVIQLNQVVKSKAYGHTDFAKQALWQQAGIEENKLHDLNASIQSLQTLHNTFPEDLTVMPQIARIGTQLDNFNKTVNPHSTPFHIFGAALYHVIDFLVQLTGRQTWSYWLAIFLISFLVKLALTPLSNKQYRSMKEMQKLQPYIQELQAKHKNDKEVLGKKTMELYKEHSINPMAGCTPLLFQLPIMYTLYYTIRLYQYQFSHGTFLWIGSSLSHMFPAYLGINLGQPDIPILLLYAASMYVTQKMTVTPTMDPQQAETQKMMAIMTPFMTTYFFLQYHLPSAFVLYYLTFNIISTAQQKYYMRKRAGDSLPGSGGDGGTKRPPILFDGGGGGGTANAIPLNGSSGNGSSNGNGSRRIPSRALSETVSAGDRDKAHSNGVTPTAKGIIAPPKVHPKKKRR
ncbi:MAG: YidC/Oxa1 family membrane protein insertase [Janthinobacterium lividum]